MLIFERTKATVKVTQDQMPQNNDHMVLNSRRTKTARENVTYEPWKNLNSKEQVMECYQGFISNLSNGVKSIQSITAKNKKFERIRQDCLGTVKKLLEESQTQMEQVINETVWDKLVIAFFGETNAGKSTIIEAFRVKYNDPARLAAIQENGGKGVDGLIVGDGRQDFTQIYEKYNLEIDGRPFVLIDVPGIEGKEANYLSEINNALKQAHCVFYVQGHNKKPDAATAEKIKGFLSDWVDVYSIYNVRGGVSNYDEEEERETLITSEVEKTQESIKDVFKAVLPGVYQGNVTCQGYLALLSVADFHESRPEMISAQAKVTKYFSGRDNIESFSRFGSIAELVQSQSKEFTIHILEANRQKLHSLSSRIRTGLDETINNQTENLDNLINQLQNFKNHVTSVQNDTISCLNSQLHSELNQAFAALKNAANDIIDDASTEDEWYDRLTFRIDTIISAFEEEVQRLYSKAFSQFKSKVGAKRKDLDPIIFRRIRLPNTDIHIRIDLTEIIDALKFNIKEDLLKGFFKAFFNPIGTLIKFFKKTDDGRDKAKRLISSLFDGAKSSAKCQIEEGASKVQNHIKQETRAIKKAINEEIKNIEDLEADLKILQKSFGQ